MKGFIGVTDNDWFTFLAQQSGIDEVNFWQPGGSRVFQSLKPVDPFFSKLHAPQNFIVGGGFFGHRTILPISLAWSAFGIKNGADSLSEMRIRTEKYRRSKKSPLEDYKSGCILLSQPYFFIRQDGILVPFNCSSTLHHKNPYGHGHLEKFALLRLTGEALPFAIHIPPTRVTMILAFAKRIEKGD